MNLEINQYLQNKKMIERLEEENKIIGEDIIKYMQENNKKEYTTPSGVITLIEETTGFRFDTKRFQEEKGLIEYNKYLKQSTTRAHLTTKLTK